MSALTSKKIYITDLETDANGEEIIATPCIIHSITAVSDAAGDASISFSDSKTEYAIASRCAKIKTTDEEHTKTITFGKGYPIYNGLCATSNKASVDVFIEYE